MWTLFSTPWKLMVWKWENWKLTYSWRPFVEFFFWTHTCKAERNTSRAAQAIDEDEKDALFEVGEFGDSNPVALQRAVWWFLSLHFGFRAKGNISQAISYCLSPLQFKLVYIVVQTKDRSAGAHKNERQRRIVIESDKDDWLWQAIFCQLCPIWIFTALNFHLTLTNHVLKSFVMEENIVWSTKNLFSNFKINICFCRFRQKRFHIQ